VLDRDEDQNPASMKDRAPKEEQLKASEGAGATGSQVEKDHRGVTLPPRHRAGGIITPQ
jgi:hypothetical protein